MGERPQGTHCNDSNSSQVLRPEGGGRLVGENDESNSEGSMIVIQHCAIPRSEACPHDTSG